MNGNIKSTKTGVRYFVFLALTASSLAVLGSMPERSIDKYSNGPTSAQPTYITTPEDTELTTESEVSSGLFDCYTESGTMDATCFEQVLLSSIKTSGTQTAMAGFNEHMTLHPESAPWCHSAAHAAGALSYEMEKASELSRILSYGGTSCIMGYVHGVLEGFASSVASPEGIKDAIAACKAAFGETSATGTCYDGVGHAAWIASKDVKESISICSGMPSDSHRETCEMGIMMQVFEPAHDKPTLEMGPDRADTTLLCDLWPNGSSSNDNDLKNGCWRGVSYLLGKGLTDKWFSSDQSPVSANFDKWRDEVVRSFKPCDLLGVKGAKTCYKEAGSYLIGDWQGHDVQLATEFCKALPASKDECAKQVSDVASSYGWS